jgi:hypothetical protein
MGNYTHPDADVATATVAGSHYTLIPNDLNL